MTEKDYETLLETVTSGDAIEKSYNTARHFVDKARESLFQLDNCQAKNDLLSFCDYMTERSF